MNNTITPLFICLANVGRSQIAEGLYNNIHGERSSFSCAGGEARKKTPAYHGKPAEGIIELMKDQAGIDISHQRIKYLSDLGADTLARVNRVVFLVKEPEKMICEEDCRHDGLTPYEFLRKSGFTISAHDIEDPGLSSQDKWISIYEEIRKVVSTVK